MDARNFVLIILFLCVSITDADEDDPCDPGDTSVYPHPKECQMYYNCSLSKDRFLPWLGDHVMECEYPNLFSTEHRECRSFKTVTCGPRTEHVHGCEYKNNQCNGPHCRPCIYDYTECTVQNGLKAIPHMGTSQYFGMCIEWRFFKLQCPKDTSGVQTVFNPQSLSCLFL